MATVTATKVDIQNLETASDYLNNLLLSRGLLRNGEPISFAHPSQEEGGKTATIAKVINLVHDLILRRDRESETLTKLSQDISSLRNGSVQQTQIISKLEARNTDLERQLALKSASEKNATTNLKTSEARNKALKEDMVRLKATVSQIRAQCANDVRKKETELKRLQKYLEPKRGREGSVQVGVTVVHPGTSGQGLADSQGSRAKDQTSLREDTTGYLTSLANRLSSENQALRSLAKSTTSTLRNLQGLADADETANEMDISQIDTKPHEDLEFELTEVLHQLQTLLTNPSFVPLEEVEIREDEIVRLREGWEKMETRWREALSLMHGWRKRMMESGDAINLDDLRKGLILGSTPISMPPPTSTRKTRISLGQLPSPDDSLVEEKSSSMSLDTQESQIRAALNSNSKLESPVRNKAVDRLGMGLFPAPKILRPITGNTQRSLTTGKRRSIEEVVEEEITPESKPGASPQKRQRVDQESLDDVLTAGLVDDATNLDDEADTPLTIEEKLARAKQEAEDAAAALRKTVFGLPEPQQYEKPTTKAVTEAEAKPVKRTKVSIKVGAGMKRSKRRSTLLPEELEELIGG